MLISIIVPIYNVEKYLNKCLDSLINQTYKNIEIILVDDGSTDRCPEICDQYIRKDNRIKVIHKKNGGLSSARNRGIKEAKGQYLLFIDSDDYIDINTCYELVKSLKKEEVDIIQFKKRTFIEGEVLDNVYNANKCSSNYTVYNNKEAYDIYMNNGQFTREAWDKLYARSLFDDIEYPEGRLAEDLATTYKLILKAKKLGFLDRELYYYLIRKDSIMGQKSIKLMEDACKGHLEIYEYNKKCYKNHVKQSMTNYYNNLVKLYCRLSNEYKKENSERINEVEQTINLIKMKELNFKGKLVCILLRFNKKLFFKMIYNKI